MPDKRDEHYHRALLKVHTSAVLAVEDDVPDRQVSQDVAIELGVLVDEST